MSGEYGKRSIASVLAIGVLAGSALAATGSGALAAGVAKPRATEATAPKPKWQVLAGVKANNTSNPAPRLLGWASGRVWAGYDDIRKFDDGFLTLVSVRPAGRALTSAVKSELVRVRGPFLIMGSELLYHPSGSVNGRIVSDEELHMARMLPSGRLGPSRQVPDNPEKRPPQELHPGVIDTIDVGGRTVWLLGAFENFEAANGNFGYRIHLWICCSETDELVTLTPLVRNTKNVHSFSLGLDIKGRLWLAWSNPVRMVQLDPITLKPRSALFAVKQTPDKFAFACAATCRVVGSDGDSISTWSAGERNWTRILRSSKTTRVHSLRGWRTLSDPNYWPNLLAASYRAGKLEVAYRSQEANPKTGFDQKITVVRGNARGSRARSVGSLVLPAGFNQLNADRYVLFHGAHATFVPGGLVALGTYTGGVGRSRVIAAFVPLGRR